MNEELQKKLLSYLDVLETGAKKAGDFAAEEVPLAIREWLTWLAVERFTYATILFILFLVAAWLNWRVGKWLRQNKDKFDGLATPPVELFHGLRWMVFTIIGGHTAFFAIDHAMTGVKVIVAPRVVIVEKVGELVKSSKPK